MTMKTFLKFLLFFSGLFQILYYLTVIFNLKDYPMPPNVNKLVSPYMLADRVNGFYSEKKNSLDVIFAGSSSIHCNINPNVLWNEFGITSYDFSSDQQELGTTYYYLQQAFETQSPKVVFIDILNSGEEDELETLQAHFSFDHMKNDQYKIKAIWNRTKKDRLEIFFPLITYHERWKELKLSDIQFRPNRHDIFHGALINIFSDEQVRPEITDDLPKYELKQNTIHWIQSILELCRENDCECIFIKTPIAIQHEPFLVYYNAFDEYCRENGIPFLYLNKMTDEIGLDFSKDYLDIVHMNWDGQQKLSTFLGKYIRDNFDIVNKKGQPGYEQWDNDYEAMIHYINTFQDLYGSQQQ